MEEQKKDQMGMCGGCGMCQGRMCGMGGGCGYHIIRWILGIAIIVIVFTLGVKLGEFKGTLESNGYRMMRASSYGDYGRAYPMMGGYYGVSVNGTQSQGAAVPVPVK